MTLNDLLPLKEHCLQQLRYLRERHRAETEPYLQTLRHIEALAPPPPLIKEWTES